MNSKIKKINFLLVIAIVLYNLFLNNIDFRYDFILTIILFLINIKTLFACAKKHKILAGLLVLYLLFIVAQTIILNIQNFELAHVLYDIAYIIVTSLVPIVFLITFDNLKFNEKEYNIFNIILLLGTIILIIYGFITYIFNFNLNIAGMWVLDNAKGRVSSLLLNPNAFAFFMECMLIYVLFMPKFNKIFKWVMVFLIMISICLTFSRFGYFSMGLTIFGYIIYNFVTKNKLKWHNSLFILFLTLLTFNLPNNNYLYISLINQLDNKVGTSFTVPIYKTIDFLVIANHSTDSDILYERIISSNESVTSSVGTRNIFKKLALEIYDENKLIGVGLTNYHYEMEEKLKQSEIDFLSSKFPHNYYILLLATNGIIGTIIMLSIIGYLVYYLFKYRHNKCYVAIAIFLTYLITNFQSDFILRYFLLYSIIVISLNLVYNKSILIKEK